jgi:hypothetical protein
MAAGKISFQDVVKSMQDATSKGGAFYQGATNGSKTLAGAWGNLTGTISSGVGMALQPALPVIDKLIGRFSDWASKKIPALQSAIRHWVNDAKNGTGAAGKFEGVLKVAGHVLSDVIGFMKTHKGEVVGFAATVGVVSAAIVILNAVMSANPVSILVVALGLLAAWFVHLYKTSKTFRTGVQAMWAALRPLVAFLGRNAVPALKILTKAFLYLAKYGVWAYKMLLSAAFDCFDGILQAAEKGLGWIPGLGGKIKSARKAFDQFGAGVKTMLDGVSQGIDQANQAIDQLGQKKASPLILLRMQTAGAGNAGLNAQHSGTFSSGGRGTVHHKVNGKVYSLNRSGVTLLPSSGGPSLPSVDASSMMPSTDTIDPVTGRNLVVPVYLDSQKVGEGVLNDFDRRAARR